MQRFILIVSFIILQSLHCFAQLPNTDIWLMDIKTINDSIVLSNPINITNREGYDNQPSFSPDGKYLLYTSMRDGKQTDIYKYDLAAKTTSQFTNTSTSEYSPNVMPDGKNVSVVMVEPDSTQRLWKFPIKGGEPSLIMKDVDSIGYYCWITDDSLALVMITEPPILEVVNKKTQKPKIFASNVARCIQKNSREVGFLFMIKSKTGNKQWVLTYSNYDHGSYAIVNDQGRVIRDNDPNTLIEPQLPEISQDYCLLYTPVSQPNIIFGYQSSILKLGWASQDIESKANLSLYGITNITRIAVSPDGKKMAIVAEPKSAIQQ